MSTVVPGEAPVAIVTGAGQTPGDTIGNGRATALLLARAGHRVLALDRRVASAQETVDMIAADAGGGAAGGGAVHEAVAIEADVTSEADCAAAVTAAVQRWGRVDVLVNNVGIGTGDASPTRLTEEAWDLIHDVNLKGAWLMAKHTVPVMREQGSGAIVNVSSAAAVCSVGFLAYKTSKAAMNALTHSLAMTNARHGIRVNAVMPGLMDTPMAIEGISAATGTDPAELRRARDVVVPLKGGMGTAWDVAEAIAFLVSPGARFITAAVLPVDGGQSARIG